MLIYFSCCDKQGFKRQIATKKKCFTVILESSLCLGSHCVQFTLLRYLTCQLSLISNNSFSRGTVNLIMSLEFFYFILKVLTVCKGTFFSMEQKIAYVAAKIVKVILTALS